MIMSKVRYCEEKKEIAQIYAEDETASERARREMARAAELWDELANQWLELELRNNLIGGLPFKRP